jgi:Icc-related predicted phosphoesterase
MRVAATADLHFTPQSYDHVRESMQRVRDEADVLILAGDLTNYGKPEEMTSLLNALVRLRIPIVAVLGNHDYDSCAEGELMKMMTTEGIKVLDGSSYERDGVGFAGTKGFYGGYGRGALTAFGEPEVKAFVQAGLNEAMKLEKALSQLRAEKRIVVTHYAPVRDTVEGEPAEIFPFLGSSRFGEVIDRFGAAFAVHGHAHHGRTDGRTTGGVPVHNVAMSLLQAQNPPCVYRVFEV